MHSYFQIIIRILRSVKAISLVFLFFFILENLNKGGVVATQIGAIQCLAKFLLQSSIGQGRIGPDLVQRVEISWTTRIDCDENIYADIPL
jgi:hypothetical protein